jgi:cobalt-zinc-cadmium efflux system membrane fusion protein
MGSAAKEKDDWCAEHAVPESQCVECNPDLLPRGKEFGWCKRHGVSECPFEHPEVAQLKGRPQVTPADLSRAQRALDLAPRPENNSKCKLHRRRIQFASQEAVEKAGLDIAPVWEAPVVEAVSANGEVTYDQTRVARLSARVPGTVWRVDRVVGQAVRRGDLLALVDAAEVGKAKGELLQAVAQVDVRTQTLDRMRPAYESGAVPEARMRETEAGLQEARIRLLGAEQALANLGLPVRAGDFKGCAAEEVARRVRFLGLPEAAARTLGTETTTANLLPLLAPLDGVVVGREAVAGEVVDATRTLFVVADTRRLWLTLHVRLEDANRLALGQPVRFRPDGGTGEAHGEVAWIDTAADERTRTVKVRADLANPEGRLRASTFGAGRIILREEASAVVVPSEAVHWEGDCFVVFVRDRDFLKEGAPKVFHVRKVRVGVRDAQNTEVIAGVLPGEVVATRGSGTLRAELLKNNLGEG